MNRFLIWLGYRLVHLGCKGREEYDEDDGYPPGSTEAPVLEPLPPPRLPIGVSIGERYVDAFGRQFRWVQTKGNVDMVAVGKMVFLDQLESSYEPRTTDKQ